MSDKDRADDTNTQSLRWLPVLVCAFIAVALIAIGYGAAVWLMFKKPENAGIFGDMFGGLNALFSGLAFSSLVVTVWMQSHELRLQREELRLQREENKKAREELTKSANAQERLQQITEISARVQALATLFSAYVAEADNRRAGRSFIGDADWSEAAKKIFLQIQGISAELGNR